jgi:hypothetical protein
MANVTIDEDLLDDDQLSMASFLPEEAAESDEEAPTEEAAVEGPAVITPEEIFDMDVSTEDIEKFKRAAEKAQDRADALKLSGPLTEQDQIIAEAGEREAEAMAARASELEVIAERNLRAVAFKDVSNAQLQRLIDDTHLAIETTQTEIAALVRNGQVLAAQRLHEKVAEAREALAAPVQERTDRDVWQGPVNRAVAAAQRQAEARIEQFDRQARNAGREVPEGPLTDRPQYQKIFDEELNRTRAAALEEIIDAYSTDDGPFSARPANLYKGGVGIMGTLIPPARTKEEADAKPTPMHIEYRSPRFPDGIKNENVWNEAE